MSGRSSSSPLRLAVRPTLFAVALFGLALLLASCSSGTVQQAVDAVPTSTPTSTSILATAAPSVQVEDPPDSVPTPASASVSESDPAANTETAETSPEPAFDPGNEAPDFYDGNLHEIAVVFDPADFDEAVETYVETRKKKWIRATVTIDGIEYAESGMRLKGNSSLFPLGGFPDEPPEGFAEDEFVIVCDGPGGPFGPDNGALPPGALPPGALPPGFPEFSSDAEDLPWLIRLDKYVNDQTHQGRADYVVRSNTTETSLNEAVSLALIGAAGLPTQQSAPVRFSVNGEVAPRLVIEHPDNRWTAANLGSGSLFKADSTGDYTYRGSDEDAYSEAWDQKSGEDDLVPLMNFLDFVNNTTDDEFASGLPDRFDVEAFARYLAVQDLINNWDDIDGPGNNSYLYFNEDGVASVVAWDHNLALMGDVGFPGPPGFPGDAEFADDGGFPGPPGDLFPEDCTFPEGFDPSEGFEDGGFGPGPFGATNPLRDRYNDVPEFAELYAQAEQDLQLELVDSQFAADAIAERAEVLRVQAGDLLTEQTIQREAEVVESALVVG